MSDAPHSTKAERFAWCLYDFGNSAYPTVIITTAYALYFREVVAADPTHSANAAAATSGVGDRLWGDANAIGALLIFLAAPLLGAAADRLGAKQKLLSIHAWLCIVTTGLLAATGPGDVTLAMVLLIASLYGFEGANVFYNAWLPELVDDAAMPGLSGRAWAFGYAGGLLCLLLVLGLEAAGLADRWFPIVVAVWFAGFTLPTMLMLRDRAPQRPAADPDRSWTPLAGWRRLRGEGRLGRFLLALFFYMNGLNTVYVFAAVFAAESLHFSTVESLVLVMLMNAVAAPGALWFARIAERRGALQSIAVSLVVWLIAIAAAVVAASPDLLPQHDRVLLFWGVAGLAALAIGATQATSRTYVGQIAPPGSSGEWFGFMAFAGKASAILGPFVFGHVSEAAGGDQRWAVGSIGAFFLVGLLLLLRVPRDA